MTDYEIRKVKSGLRLQKISICAMVYEINYCLYE